METSLVRALVAAKMREYYPNATLWPNGLGFDTRGWSFSYSEQDHKWHVSKTRKGIRVHGVGENPFDAYAHARPVREG